MAPIDQKQRAERRMLALLADSGMPLPDEVEYGTAEVRFLWHDLKVAVVVELGDFDELDSRGGYDREDVAA
jgi:hypothetical protein